MLTKGVSLIVLLALWLPGLAAAETAYVSDKVVAGLRPQPDKELPPLKTVSTGAVLEVLERMGNFARVRDTEGAEGWIDAGVLSAEPPARMQLDSLKAQMTGLKGQLEKTQATLAQATAKSAELAKKLAEKAALAEQAAAEKAPAAAAPEAVPPAPPIPDHAAAAGHQDQGSSWFSLGWTAFSFAMLVIGFFAGMAWLREVNRRKLGGMYLRI
jgi:hypothetical protein